MAVAVILVLTVQIMMTVVIIWVFAMLMVVAEQPSACKIHSQSNHGDGDRLIKADGHGVEQPNRRLVSDQKCNHGEDDCARVSSELAELAGAKPNRSSWACRRAKRYARAAMARAPACVNSAAVSHQGH